MYTGLYLLSLYILTSAHLELQISSYFLTTIKENKENCTKYEDQELAEAWR